MMPFRSAISKGGKGNWGEQGYSHNAIHIGLFSLRERRHQRFGKGLASATQRFSVILVCASRVSLLLDLGLKVGPVQRLARLAVQLNELPCDFLVLQNVSALLSVLPGY